MGPPKLSATRMRRTEIFDVHLHCPDPDDFLEWTRADFGAWRDWPGKFSKTNDELMTETLRQMDQNNVRVGVVSYVGNRNVTKWVEAHPDRFLPSFRPDFSLTDHRDAAARFEEELKDVRWRAMGELGLAYNGLALNDSKFYPYYEVAERNGLPVAFHTGFNGAENRSYRAEMADPLLLQDVVAQFPKLRVILFHMGWPFFDHALYMHYAFRNVYLDTGAVSWILGPSVFHRMVRESVETAGSDRLLFGSDQMVWPQMIGRAVASIRDAPYLTAHDKRQILWENSAKLFGLSGVTRAIEPRSGL